jgi:hypothetical protein
VSHFWDKFPVIGFFVFEVEVDGRRSERAGVAKL